MLNTEKYENLILALCNGSGGSVCGREKLVKLLYYADFDKFEYHESMQSITGDVYLAGDNGPEPYHLDEMLHNMQSKGSLKISRQDNSLDLRSTVKDPELSALTKEEQYIVNRVLAKYGNLNARELKVLTRAEAPFAATEASQEIVYEMAFYRGTDFS